MFNHFDQSNGLQLLETFTRWRIKSLIYEDISTFAHQIPKILINTFHEFARN